MLAMRLRAFSFALLAAFSAGCETPRISAGMPPPALGSPVAGVPAEALNPDVRQETIQQTICVSGYTASARPSTSYTNGVKAKLLRETGRPPTAASDYELDHRVPRSHWAGTPEALRTSSFSPGKVRTARRRRTAWSADCSAWCAPAPSRLPALNEPSTKTGRKPIAGTSRARADGHASPEVLLPHLHLLHETPSCSHEVSIQLGLRHQLL